MDETTKAQGTPPATGPSSSGEAGTTPPPKTYTEAEFRKAISDLKAEAGRKEKQLANTLTETQAARQAAEKHAESVSTRLEVLEGRINEKEMEGIRDNPSLVKLYQDKQSLTAQLREHEKKERDLAVREARVATREAEAQDTKKSALLSLVADKVTPEELEKLRGLEMVALEVMADLFAKDPTPHAAPGAPEFKPDSAVSSGGVGAITPEWAETATPEEYAERRKKLSPEKFKP